MKGKEGGRVTRLVEVSVEDDGLNMLKGPPKPWLLKDQVIMLNKQPRSNPSHHGRSPSRIRTNKHKSP